MLTSWLLILNTDYGLDGGFFAHLVINICCNANKQKLPKERGDDWIYTHIALDNALHHEEFLFDYIEF